MNSFKLLKHLWPKYLFGTVIYHMIEKISETGFTTIGVLIHFPIIRRLTGLVEPK